MKKVFFLFSVLFSFSLYAQEIVLQDFESGFVGKWGTNGNIGSSADENHDNFSIVNNPAKSDINNSDKVGKFHRLKSGNWWALAWFDFNEIQINATMAKPEYLHISVYKPIASTVCIQVKDIMYDPTYNTGEISNNKQVKINEWQDLVFKISSSGTFKMMEVKPDFVSSPSPADRLDGDIDIYFDNIVINDDPTPVGEEPEPLPEFKGNLPEGFEGENTLIDPVFYGDYFGTYGQPSESTDLTVVDNPAKVGVNTTAKCAKFVRKITGEWWAGVYMTPLNQMKIDETNKYFHIMVYKETEPTSLSLKLEGPNGDTGDIILEGSVDGIYDWIDYVFEIPAEKYGTYGKIDFMPDFYSALPPSERFFNDISIYFDALELNNDPAPRTSAVITGLSVVKNDASTNWVQVEKSGNISVNLPDKEIGYSVQLYNVSGQLINVMKNLRGSTTIPTSPLKGVYIVKITTSTGKVNSVKVCL